MALWLCGNFSVYGCLWKLFAVFNFFLSLWVLQLIIQNQTNIFQILDWLHTLYHIVKSSLGMQSVLQIHVCSNFMVKTELPFNPLGDVTVMLQKITCRNKLRYWGQSLTGRKHISICGMRYEKCCKVKVIG